MTRNAWLLLTLRYAHGAGLSPIQLQKALFLLEREMPDTVGEAIYHFEPYNYGPFDKAVFEDAKALAEDGLVKILQATETKPKQYLISAQGLAKSDIIEKEAPARGIQYLKNVVEWIQGLPVQELIRSIYRKYPEFKANSVFQEQQQ